ncbi:MAG: BatD family protein [Thermodesulfobacteriota bacterium]
MRKTYISILICLAALLGPAFALAQLSATVDRDQIALDETLTLTITKDGMSSISSDDLQPLAKDFRIMGQSQSSNTQFINGSVSSFFSLNLVLAPKRAGKLEIPSLSIGKESTDRLYIKVVTQAQPKTKADIAPLYLETDVSARTVFVQSQLIFTLRIFWAVEASISEPIDPQLKDALVERLDDATFNKVIDGQSYKVFERKYAIFPQKSGVLEIPQVIVQATIPNRQRHGNIYDLFGSRGQGVKLRSESESITVKEKPSRYPAGAEWLPTDKLSVAEEWSQEPGELQVGESATITITMAGQGLLGSQLPPIELPETEGVKLYQGKAEVQNLTNSAGITGTRKESIALIPIRAGQVELPEIRVPWWNKKEQKVAYAVIPARQLLIKASTANGQTTTPIAPADNLAAPASAPVSAAPAPKMTDFNKPLLALCAVLLLAWLLTIYLLIRTRRQMATLVGGKRPESGNNEINESEAFKKFGRACRSNDPGRARGAVIDWVKASCPGAGVQTAADIARVFPESKLAALLAEIDSLLYSNDGEVAGWCGKRLLETVEMIRKANRAKKSPESALPGLYR